MRRRVVYRYRFLVPRESETEFERWLTDLTDARYSRIGPNQDVTVFDVDIDRSAPGRREQEGNLVAGAERFKANLERSRIDYLYRPPGY